jgi:site-specific recombinase XerD
MTNLAPVLHSFFTDRLSVQRQASPNTIAAYRDTFRLLLGHATQATGKPASKLALADLDAGLITGFLHHLEHDRHDSARSRNARLAAIHSLFSYAALRCPEEAAVIQRVLAIPSIRAKRNIVTYLDDTEASAFLAACDQDTRTGRRDHALFTLAIQTGLRVSELINLTVADIHLGTGPNVHCLGKGRKERRTPLTHQTLQLLTCWIGHRHPEEPLFTTTTGRQLSRDAIEHRVKHTAALAAQHCPSLAAKNITAHTLRHTAAMRLLRAGIDITVIALWLGHEQVTTTNIYLHADMTQKQEAIAKTGPLGPAATSDRYQPEDTLLAFLAAL